jgi:hypothetical protein
MRNWLLTRWIRVESSSFIINACLDRRHKTSRSRISSYCDSLNSYVFFFFLFGGGLGSFIIVMFKLCYPTNKFNCLMYERSGKCQIN